MEIKIKLVDKKYSDSKYIIICNHIVIEKEFDTLKEAKKYIYKNIIKYYFPE